MSAIHLHWQRRVLHNDDRCRTHEGIWKGCQRNQCQIIVLSRRTACRTPGFWEDRRLAVLCFFCDFEKLGNTVTVFYIWVINSIYKWECEIYQQTSQAQASFSYHFNPRFVTCGDREMFRLPDLLNPVVKFSSVFENPISSVFRSKKSLSKHLDSKIW